MTVMSLLQDPVNAGGIGTVNRWYRSWMDLHRPGERGEFYLDDQSSTLDLLRDWSTWNGSERAIPRLLPALHLPQYWSGRRLLSRVGSSETHVVGAVAVHGAVASQDTPTLVWCATTIGDERRAVIPHHGLARRSLHRATLSGLEALESGVLRSASRVLAMSPHTARCIHRLGVPLSNICVRPVPVDTDVFRPREGERRGVLFVGRVRDPRKGFGRVLDLLRTSAVVMRHGIMVVSPGDRITVGDKLDSAITWSTELPDISTLYSSAAVLILPSYQEGLGIVAFEALASATPVVALPCGGPDDYLRESRGAIVASDFRDFVRGVETFLGDPNLGSQFGARGRHWVEANMSARQFLALPGLFRLP